MHYRYFSDYGKPMAQSQSCSSTRFRPAVSVQSRPPLAGTVRAVTVKKCRRMLVNVLYLQAMESNSICRFGTFANSFYSYWLCERVWGVTFLPGEAFFCWMLGKFSPRVLCSCRSFLLCALGRRARGGVLTSSENLMVWWLKNLFFMSLWCVGREIRK